MSFKDPTSSPYPPSGKFHGCKILLRREPYGAIHHVNWDDFVSLPTIRSYEDGIKVGCTFLTTDALKALYDWHKEFLGREESRTHQ